MVPYVGSFTDISMKKSLFIRSEFIADVDVNSVLAIETLVVLYERLQILINEINTKKAAPNFVVNHHILCNFVL